MEIKLTSTMNTRAILPDSLRFIRSDVPDKITDQEAKWLIAQNITTIIDLRTDEERIKKKCSLTGNPQFQYHCIPVTGGNAVPNSADDVSKSYINMVDAQMARIVDLIWHAKSNVLYFCNAGKDRTGVVSAILLTQMGMDREYIIEDYMKSKDNLRDVLAAYSNQFPEIDIDVITPCERYLQEFLDWYITKSKVLL